MTHDLLSAIKSISKNRLNSTFLPLTHGTALPNTNKSRQHPHIAHMTHSQTDATGRKPETKAYTSALNDRRNPARRRAFIINKVLVLVLVLVGGTPVQRTLHRDSADVQRRFNVRCANALHPGGVGGYL